MAPWTTTSDKSGRDKDSSESPLAFASSMLQSSIRVPYWSRNSRSILLLRAPGGLPSSRKSPGAKEVSEPVPEKSSVPVVVVPNT